LTTSDCDVVAALHEAIARRIGERTYNLWFEPNTKFTWDNELLLIGVPNYFLQEYLQNKFAGAVRAAAGEVFAGPVEARFVIDPELFQAARRAQSEVHSPDRGPRSAAGGVSGAEPRTPEAERAAADAAKGTPDEKRPSDTCRQAHSQMAARAPRNRRWHRLSDFVVGACNRVAHASALSVVEAPAEGPNPLVFHGPVGTGKTHLLEGIYAGLRKKHGHWRVCYVTTEDFTNRFVQAMRLGKLGTFRKHFRECDALLIDDIHFLTGKRATQEEFLHTFDALQADGKQVVVACDCHPRLADQYTPELADRLLGGGVWSLAPPEQETRLALLRAKSSADGQAPFSEEVVRFVADQLRGNVRELEGAVHSLRHLARVTSRPIDLELARAAIGELIRHAVRVVQLADVDRALCRVLHLEPGALQSKQRAWVVCHPRMLAMFLARKHSGATYGEIGSHFGGRNHSTAVAAEKKVRQWLEKDGELTLGERPLRAREVVELVERELLR
jgi:chromosomal replication initiator protein